MSFGANYLPGSRRSKIREGLDGVEIVERRTLLRRTIALLQIVEEPKPRRIRRPRAVVNLERSEAALERRKLEREYKQETAGQKVRRSSYDRALYLRKKQARHFATIRGLLELQRKGILWLWVDEGEIRVAPVPNWARSRRITIQQAGTILSAGRLGE